VGVTIPGVLAVGRITTKTNQEKICGGKRRKKENEKFCCGKKRSVSELSSLKKRGFVSPR